MISFPLVNGWVLYVPLRFAVGFVLLVWTIAWWRGYHAGRTVARDVRRVRAKQGTPR